MDALFLTTGWAMPALLFVMAASLLYVLGTRTYATWTQLMVPGPRPYPFVGNISYIWKKGLTNALTDWGKQYGRVYGIYMFNRPCLVISDSNCIKASVINDFRNFNVRSASKPLQSSADSLFFSSGKTWKRQKRTMSVAFSNNKLKNVEHFITDCCKNLIPVLENTVTTATPMHVKDVFGAFTLDVMMGVVLGVDTKSQGKRDDPLLKALVNTFQEATEPSLPFILASIFPRLQPLLRKLGYELEGLSSIKFTLDYLEQLIKDRKASASSSQGVDLVQLMLNTEATEEELKIDPERNGMTDKEIVAQSFLFFVAGNETTSNTLQFLFYLLALNPDKQELLHQEIVTCLGDAEPSCENVSELPYLDCFIRETMRYYPVVPMFGRETTETRTFNGFTVPAGSRILVSTTSLCQDEEYFPEPERFLPERFDQEQGDDIPQFLREMPFGAGPRRCLGKPLALMTMKTVVAFVCRRYKFVKIQQTPETIKFSATMMPSPSQAIFLGVQKWD